MPVVIPFIAYAAGTAAGYSAITVAAITLVASIAVAEYEKIQAQQEARQAYLNSLQNRLIQIRSGVAPRGYVLGKVRLGGALLYIQTLGSRREALDEVVAFANNECALVDLILGDEFIPSSSFPGSKYGTSSYQSVSDVLTVLGPTNTITLTGVPKSTSLHVTWRQAGNAGIGAAHVVSGNQIAVSGLPSGSSEVTISYQTANADKLRSQFMPGNLTQTVSDWAGYPNSEWDSTHQLLGVCHSRTLMVWDQNLFQNGAPTVTAVLSGKSLAGFPFYDPRDGSNPAATTNPAILAGWWMTLPRYLGGMGIPTDWIDWTTVAAAANICDEIVTVRTHDGTGYESITRYACDTYLGTDVSPIDNFNTILSSMAGRRAFTGGKYKIFAGAFRPAAITLTDSDLVGTKPMSVNTANINSDPPNVVTASFVDAYQVWQQSNPKPVRNDTYVAADGYENPLDLKLSASTDARRVRYLMGIELERGRPAFGVSCSITGIGETLGLYDTVQLNLVNRPQYAGRTFEIASMIDNWDGTFDITLAELKSTTFVLDPDSYTPVNPVAPTDNSYLWDPPEPTGFAISSIVPTTLPDGTAVARVELVWDPITSAGNTPDARFELRYRKTGGNYIDGGAVPGDATATTLTTALQDGEVYQFELRFVNGIGAYSDWVDAYTSVAGTPLPTPLSMRISASSVLFRVPQTGNALPTLITLSLIRTGGLSPAATWSTSPAVTLGGAGDTRTLSFANDTSDSVQITATVIQSGVTYVDTVTIVKVYDGANATVDLTAPPTPTGLTLTAFLSHILVNWDTPTFTVGHGYAATNVYAAQVISGQSAPNFATAKNVGSSASNGFAFAADPGTTWAIWIKYQTNDGVLSASPAGGTNGIQATTAQIGTANLANDLITAAQLAAGSVGASELAAGAIDATKFASGVQPVTILTGALPGANIGALLYHTDDDKLYRWNGTTYTAQTQAADVAGQFTDAQLFSIAAAKVTGTIASTQIADGAISTPKLAAGSVTSAQIAADTITAGNIAAGAIGVSELAANSVTAGAIAANSVTAGKIAAGAVSASQIAAGAITTDKLLVTGKGAALNDDPGCSDVSAWDNVGGAGFTIVTITDGASGTTAMRSANGAYSQVESRRIPLDPAKTYRARALVRNVGSNGNLYLRIYLYDSSGSAITTLDSVANVSVPSTFTAFSGVVGAGTSFPFPSTAKSMTIMPLLNYPATTGYMEAQDVRIEEMIGSSLIVDGGITATKLAANSIVVGTAAIQNGAIVNAMLGNAVIDSAKIIDASVQTLKIAGNAVTVPVAATNSSQLGPFTNTLIFNQIISASIDATDCNAVTIAMSSSLSGNSTAVFSGPLRITRDGSVIFHRGIAGQFPSVVYMDSPGNGVHTYAVSFQTFGGTGFVDDATIVLTGTKR